MNLDELDDQTPFVPDDSFRSGVRRRGRALRHRRRRRIGAAVATPLLAGAASLTWLDSRIDEVDSIEVAMPGSDVASGGPVDILLVGTDTGLHGTEGPPNADAIALVRIDATAGAVRVMPIPRDLGVVAEDGTPGRLANVRATSGPDGLVAAVEHLLTVDGSGPGIDHYVELDTGALAGLVDSAGGVPLYNHGEDLVDERSGARLEHGCQVVDGQGFVALSRSRRPTGPDGRDLSEGGGDLHRMETNTVLGIGLAEALLEMQPTPGALVDLLGPVVEGLSMDSGLSVRRLVELGWAARSYPNEPGRAPVVILPVEEVTDADGRASLALGSDWELALRIWRGDDGKTDDPVGAEGTLTETPSTSHTSPTVVEGLRSDIAVDPGCR